MATVLVVDDQHVNRDLVRTILGYEGYRVIEAASGDEALDIIHGTAPDLVITDILMPGVDGCELVHELRANPSTAEIPVIFCTANYDEPEIGPLATAYGVAHVLTKGFDPKELLDSVKEVLAGRSATGQRAPADDVIREQLRTVNAKLIEKVRAMEVQEEELRDSEARFRQMAECPSVGIALGDADGNAWYVNARLVEIMACEVEDLLGAGWRRRLNVHQLNHSEWTSDKPISLRRPYLDEDTIKWLSITISLALGDDGVPSGTVATVSDVTAVVDAELRQKELDTRIRVGERLESLGRLAAGVAHDFNNILTAILAFTKFTESAIIDGMAQSQVDEGVGTAMLGHLKAVLGAGDKAAKLTAQLLTFGRPDLARPEILDVNDVVTEVEGLLVRTIGADIEMITDRGDDLRPVRIDASQLSQVVLNLAVNARDAMRGGGTLNIRTRNLIADPATSGTAKRWRTADNPAADLPAGRYVHLSFTDTGHGIPPEVLARVFEPFFTTKPVGEGTGLGLATVHSIVHQAGGRMAIETALDRGTTVNVYLPATDGKGALTEEEPADVGGDETILVVDDEEAICDIAQRILRASGYQAVSATSGAAAIALAESRPVDLLITDVVMPHMTGLELGNTIAARHPGTKVLIMSGYAENYRDNQHVLAMDIDFLSKPFTAATLRRAVRTVLDDKPRDRA